MRKGRLLRAVYAMLMCVLIMTASAVVTMLHIPQVNAAADVYWSEIAVSGAGSEGEAKSQLTRKGFTVCNYDMNNGAGGKYIYIGYKTTTDYMKAIKSVASINSSTVPTGYTGATVVSGNGDLNQNSKGDYIYLVYTTDENSEKSAVSGCQIGSSVPQSGRVKNLNNGAAQDFNSGAGGEYIYMYLEMKVHTHSWKKAGIISRPTCTVGGINLEECETCSGTRKTATEATGHTWDKGVVTKQPTETAKGIIKYTCTVCNAKRTASIDSTGKVGDEAAEPDRPAQTYESDMYKELGFALKKSDTDAVSGNPYTSGVGATANLNKISELVITGKAESGSMTWYDFYNKDLQDNASGTGMNMGWYDGNKVGSTGGYGDHSLMEGAKNQKESWSYGVSSSEDCYASSRMAALDLDGDGYEDTIAEIGVHWNGGTAELHFLNARTGKKYSYRESYSLGYDKLNVKEIGAYAVLVSGDFDGDGCDEVAVYKPSREYVVTDGSYGYNKSVVQVYKPSLDGGDISVKVIASDVIDKGCRTDSSKSTPVIMDLEAEDMDGDGKAELLAASSFPNKGDRKQLHSDGSFFGIFSVGDGEFKELYSRRLAFKNDEYGIKNSATYNKSTMQAMNFCGITVGDMDNDGYKEIVVGGYAVDGSDGYSIRGIINVVMFGYRDGAYKALYGGIPYNLAPLGYIADHSYYDDYLQEPVAIKAFAGRGSSFGDVLYLEGRTYTFDSAGVSQPSLNTYFNGGNGGSYEITPKTSSVTKLASQYAWNDDNGYTDIRIGSTEMTNVWISEVVAGNFNGNSAGQEQVIAVICMKRQSGNGYWYDLSALSRLNVGNGSGSYTKLYERNIVDNSGMWNGYVSLCPVDYDDDGMIVRYDGSDRYYSDPNVVAVLQAAPYFADLATVDENYSTNGSTTYGLSHESGSSDSAGVSVSAGVITGYENDCSVLGITDAAGIDIELSATVNAGYEEEIGNAREAAIQYSGDAENNNVVLAMTPYTRYRYWTYIKPYDIPAESEYKAIENGIKEALEKYDMALLDEDYDMASYYFNQYKNYVSEKTAFDNLMKSKTDKIVYGEIVDGRFVEKTKMITVDFGTHIDGYWTPYYVCVPDTPRMSMISVEKYDEIARQRGLEEIDGNLLKNTPGDPYTYSAGSGSYGGFDGGEVIGDVSGSGDNFVNVGTGRGSITQSITKTESTSKTFTYGTSVDFSYVAKAGGVKMGFSMGTEISGGCTWSTVDGASFEGTVACSPSDAYSFSWRFGMWDASLNGKPCKMLGYLVKDTKAPPALPKNFQVVQSTSDSITLGWDTPTRMDGVRGYVIDIVEDSGERINLEPRLGSLQTRYTVHDLAPATVYRFEIRSIGAGEESSKNIACVYSEALVGKTKYESGDNAPKITSQPADANVFAGDLAEFGIAVEAMANSKKEVRYQWQYLDDEEDIWCDVELDSAVTDTLAVPAVKEDMNGRQYRCVVSQESQGITRSIISDVAKLVIMDKLSTITTLAKISDESGELDGSIDLAASVSSSAQVPAGTVKFVMTNTSTGQNESITEKLVSGTSKTTWTPSAAGVYRINAEYTSQSTKLADSRSAGQRYIVKNRAQEDIYSIVVPDKVTFGDKVELKAEKTSVNEEGAIVSEDVEASWKILQDDADDITNDETNGETNNETSINEGVWTVSQIPGKVTVEAIMLRDGKEIRITQNVVIDKADVQVKAKNTQIYCEDYEGNMSDLSDLVIEGAAFDDAQSIQKFYTLYVKTNEIIYDDFLVPAVGSYTLYVKAVDAETDDEKILYEELQSKYNFIVGNAKLTFARSANDEIISIKKTGDVKASHIRLAEIVKLLPAKVAVNTKYHTYTEVPVVWDIADMEANYSYENEEAAEFKLKGAIDISECEKLETGDATYTYVTVRIAAHEHTYDIVTYTWNKEFTKCTATASCTDFEHHKLTETVKASYKTVKAPTAGRSGSGQFTAKFKNSLFSTQTKAVTEKFVAAPAVCTVKKNSTTQYTVSWSKVDGVSGYQLYYKKDSGKYMLYGTFTTRNRTAVVKNLKATGKYSFKVRAVSADKLTYSTFTQGKLWIVSAPSKLVVRKASKTSVKVSWTKAAGSYGYELYYRAGKGAFKKYGTVSSQKLSCTVSKLNPNVTYSFKVRTVGENRATYSACTKTYAVNMKKALSIDEVKLKKASISLTKGKTVRAAISVPVGKTAGQIRSKTYRTSNSKICTVSKTGTVKAVKKGSAYVYVKVTLKNGDAKTFKMKVTVK